MAMLRHLLACTCVAALRLPAPLRRNPQQRQKPKVAVLGGGFAGLTAARRLKNNRAIGEVILLEQKHYFEYTPGILRAWVDAHEHRRLVKPLAKLFRGRRATFARVAPGAAAKITHADDALTLDVGAAGSDGHVSIRCDYAVLATGASLAPISDDRLHAGSVAARRERLEAQIAAVLRPNVTSALVVGGGLTGVELAAELAEYFGNGSRQPPRRAPVGARRRDRRTPASRSASGRTPSRACCRASPTASPRGYAAEHLAARVQRASSWAVPPPDGGGAVATSVPAGAPRWRDAGEIPASFFRVFCTSTARGAPRFSRPGRAEPRQRRDPGGRRLGRRGRGARPQRRRRPTAAACGPSAAFGDDGLPPGCVGPRGWVAVDDSWRLADGAGTRSSTAACTSSARRRQAASAARPVDAAEEGEYAAACIARHARGRRPPKPYAPPPSVCAISLGKRDGVVVAGSRVLLRGRAAAAAKGAVQYWAVRFLPKPVTVWRRARR
ncbi:oxidoreductase [Aureococcus anophagefferens]|nr:oxidoreductase [Aureococcus anophagefferens]